MGELLRVTIPIYQMTRSTTQIQPHLHYGWSILTIFVERYRPGLHSTAARDFTGIAQTFDHDASFLGNEPIGNDTVNAIRLCGYNARLYRDPDWNGVSEEFTGQ